MILVNLIEISEWIFDFLSFLHLSVKLDKEARGLTEHDSVLTFKGHVWRTGRPYSSKACIWL